MQKDCSSIANFKWSSLHKWDFFLAIFSLMFANSDFLAKKLQFRFNSRHCWGCYFLLAFEWFTILNKLMLRGTQKIKYTFRYSSKKLKMLIIVRLVHIVCMQRSVFTYFFSSSSTLSIFFFLRLLFVCLLRCWFVGWLFMAVKMFSKTDLKCTDFFCVFCLLSTI